MQTLSRKRNYDKTREFQFQRKFTHQLYLPIIYNLICQHCQGVALLNKVLIISFKKIAKWAILQFLAM